MTDSGKAPPEFFLGIIADIHFQKRCNDQLWTIFAGMTLIIFNTIRNLKFTIYIN